MATSTIPAFKAALLERLALDPGLAGVRVDYGMSLPPGNHPDWVWFGDTRSDDGTNGPFPGGQRAATLGLQRREERYVLEAVVSVLRPARERQQTVTERAFELAAAIEESVRAWGAVQPAFGGVVRWAQVTDLVHREFASTTEREARVLIDISCAARI